MPASHAGAIKLFAHVGAFVYSLRWGTRPGYMITGDLHSGGPLFGFPVLLVVALLIGWLLFHKDWQEWDKRVRQNRE